MNVSVPILWRWHALEVARGCRSRPAGESSLHGLLIMQPIYLLDFPLFNQVFSCSGELHSGAGESRLGLFLLYLINYRNPSGNGKTWMNLERPRVQGVRRLPESGGQWIEVMPCLVAADAV